MVKLFANSTDPDRTPHLAASGLGLHYLSNTLLGVSRLLKFVYLNCLLLVKGLFMCFSVELK